MCGLRTGLCNMTNAVAPVHAAEQRPFFETVTNATHRETAAKLFKRDKRDCREAATNWFPRDNM